MLFDYFSGFTVNIIVTISTIKCALNDKYYRCCCLLYLSKATLVFTNNNNKKEHQPDNNLAI